MALSTSFRYEFIVCNFFILSINYLRAIRLIIEAIIPFSRITRNFNSPDLQSDCMFSRKIAVGSAKKRGKM